MWLLFVDGIEKDLKKKLYYVKIWNLNKTIIEVIIDRVEIISE